MEILTMKYERRNQYIEVNYELETGTKKYFRVDLDTGKIGGKTTTHLMKPITNCGKLYSIMTKDDSPLVKALGRGILYSSIDNWTIGEEELKTICFVRDMIDAGLDSEAIDRIYEEFTHKYLFGMRNHIINNTVDFIEKVKKMGVIENKQTYFVRYLLETVNIENREKYDEKMINDLIEFMADDFYGDKLKYLLERFNYILYYFDEGLFDFTRCMIGFKHPFINICRYFEMCDVMKIEYAKENFLKSFKTVVQKFIKEYDNYGTSLCISYFPSSKTLEITEYLKTHDEIISEELVLWKEKRRKENR